RDGNAVVAATVAESFRKSRRQTSEPKVFFIMDPVEAEGIFRRGRSGVKPASKKTHHAANVACLTARRRFRSMSKNQRTGHGFQTSYHSRLLGRRNQLHGAA